MSTADSNRAFGENSENKSAAAKDVNLAPDSAPFQQPLAVLELPAHIPKARPDSIHTPAFWT